MPNTEAHQFCYCRKEYFKKYLNDVKNYERKEKKIFWENIFLHMVFEVKDRTIFNGHKIIQKEKEYGDDLQHFTGRRKCICKDLMEK